MRDFKRLAVDHGDIVSTRASHEDARSVRLDLDAGRALAEIDALQFFVRGGVQNGEPDIAQRADENQFAVGRELQAVGALHIGGQSLNYLLRREIDDGDRAILRVGCPKLFAVGSNIESFRTPADGHYSLLPVAAGVCRWRMDGPRWRTIGTR